MHSLQRIDNSHYLLIDENGNGFRISIVNRKTFIQPLAFSETVKFLQDSV